MSFPPVAFARPAPVTDRQLALHRRIAHDAAQGLASEAEAEWLLSVAGPLFDELAIRRAWMEEHAPRADLQNVITLAAVR